MPLGPQKGLLAGLEVFQESAGASSCFIGQTPGESEVPLVRNASYTPLDDSSLHAKRQLPCRMISFHSIGSCFYLFQAREHIIFLFDSPQRHKHTNKANMFSPRSLLNLLVSSSTFHIPSVPDGSTSPDVFNIPSTPEVTTSLVSRHVTEYLLPVAAQTHEFARVPNTDFLLLSQMSNSQLVKIQLDPNTEEPVAFQAFPMGANSKAGLHGIWPSSVYPGLM